MHSFVAEAVPLVPFAGAGGAAALGLLALLGTLLATGMLKAWDETLGSFLRHLANWIDVSVLGRHPLRSVAKLIRTADAQVRNAFAGLALKGEQASAWCFTQAGHMFWWSVHETAQLAEDTLSAFQRVTVQTIPGAIRRSEAATLARLRGIDQTVGRLEAQAKAQLKRLQVGIDRLEGRITSALRHDVAALSARVGATSRQLRRQARSISHIERLLGTAAFTAAVGLALTRLVGPWIRCPSLRNIGRKTGCRGFAWIETFFAEAFEALLVLDLCRFALGAQRLARLIVPQLGAVLLVQNAVCLGGGATLPSASDRPRVSTRITLPSAHD